MRCAFGKGEKDQGGKEEDFLFYDELWLSNYYGVPMSFDKVEVGMTISKSTKFKVIRVFVTRSLHGQTAKNLFWNNIG